MSWQNLSYTKKGTIVGLTISLLVMFVVGFFPERFGKINGILSFATILSPITIFFGFIGSFVDLVKNKRKLPIIIFSIILLIIIGTRLVSLLI